MKTGFTIAVALCACVPFSMMRGQTYVSASKVLDYKQPVSPIGTDNYQYSTYYYNGKKAYNLKGFPIGEASFKISSLQYSPAGSAYALLSTKKDKSVVEIFDAWEIGKVLYTLQTEQSPTAICYSSDSRHFFVADASGGLFVYETRQYTVEKRLTLPFAPTMMKVSSNGYFITAVNGSQAAVINQETGQTRSMLTVPGTIVDLTFSQNADKLGLITQSGVLQLYDAGTFQMTKQAEMGNGAHSLSFHPEGKYVAVMTSANDVTFVNIADDSDRPTMHDEDGGMSYVRFLKDGKQQDYLTYNTSRSIKYKILKGLSPNMLLLLTNELNARMTEWAKMRPGETMEQYQNRVNEQGRQRQVRLFEQEIATELANGLVMRSEISLGNYNPENNMLTLNFDNMPQIYLTVPENEMTSFMNPADLEFRDVVYGLNRNEKFEITYAMVYNKATGKSYEFNNLERHSLDFLKEANNFVSIELIRQSSMDDVKLQAIRNDVVSAAISDHLISNHTNIQVSSNVVADMDANGNKITNYQVNFNYTVEGNYSVKEDFAAGKYKIEQSHAAISMLNIVTKAFEKDFAPYIKSGKKVIVKVTGSADALKISGVIPYDGCYGEFVNEPYYLDGGLNSLTVTRKSGIRKNEQLAFMRAVGVKDYIERHIPRLRDMQTDYQYHIELSENTGGEFRRINVTFTFVDAFDR